MGTQKAIAAQIIEGEADYTARGQSLRVAPPGLAP
jgi:hypothetical protein